ncbi:MAG: ABC transporter permease [Chloroflexi bacterium]|nr:ABC transporter permease [Chloroflexota bacterium]MDL1885815.1 ABC transporter permease [Anaerolineae bacterium CFX8]
MFGVLRDLLRYDGRFRLAVILLGGVAAMILLSYNSPYDPGKSFVVPWDLPPSQEHLFGTTSRGQDLFWWLTFAVRNSLFLGVLTAIISRIIAILIGLTAGYRGGWLDRVLMSLNDTFVVLPLLPILILLGFLLRDRMNLFYLAVILGLFGWPFDARLIRSQVLSLKERSFTRTAVYSGTSAFWITINEHLPFVLPIVFATTINNILWSIGMEVTLSVLGLSDLTTPTLGTALFWANQHGALVAGVWWWIAAPALVTIVLFLGLYLLFTSINEFIDPRTRLRLIGG